ncbi:retrotransposon protein, putative, ty1-copia subclass [Tanacetum coccineum]
MNLKRTRNFIENEIDKDIMSIENGVNPPAPNPAHNSNFSLLSVLRRERLTGPNYMDWMRNLRFTLRYENKEYVLDEQILTIDDDSTQEEIEAHRKHYDDANKVSCIMASSMSPELQKTFENTWAYEMNQQLKEMFQAKASKERLDVVKSLMACKPKPEASICTFVLEMKGYFDRLESLNMVFDAKLSINIILSGKAAKGKSDRGSKRKAEFEIAPISDPKEAMCFYCNTNRHWKRSCPNYLKDFKDGKVKKGSHSGSKGSRMLKHGKLNLVMENRKIKPMTRIGKYELMPKSGVRIDLNNCFYLSEMTRNIISFHALFKDGYRFSFDNENGDILVYSNGCFMFKASPCKDIYEFVECISHNGNVILNVVSSNELDKSKLCRYGHVYLIKHKSDTFEVFKRYQNEVENQRQKDKELTPTRTPQLNRVAERRNITLLDMVQSMMSRATLPISFWGYALETTAHILNPVPTTKDKLEAKSEKCLFVSYPKESFRYLFYKPKDNVVIGARRGVFLEREIISKEDSGSKIDLEEIQEYVDEEPIVNTDTQQEVVTPIKLYDISLPIRRTSGRVSKPPQFYYGFHIKEDKISDSTLSELDEPANCKEAMASPEVAKWKEAMKSDMQSVYNNQVWNLVDTTPGLKTVGCKWIFKKKTNMDGKVHTYKARLAAKSYTQTHGIDYEETFSPVAKKNPGKGHWTAVKNILKYLRNTKDMLLVYGGEEELRGAVTWKSSKQDTVADSTCESEYIAACEASKEAI